ncbi:hypothetical protein ES703_06438 [subsurface metagenome]
MGFHLHQKPLFLQISQNRLAAGEAVKPMVRACLLVHRPIGVQDIHQGQSLTLADLEVHRVMGWGYLHRPGAERGVYSIIGDDGDPPANDRQDSFSAQKVPVAIILWVYRHGGVAEDGLRASGGHCNKAILIGEGVADIVEMSHLLLMFHLQVGEGGGATRAPVNDALPAVNEALLIKADEGGAHRS